MGDDDGVTNAGFEETSMDCELGAVNSDKSQADKSEVNEVDDDDDDLDAFTVSLLDDFDQVPLEQRNCTYHLMRFPVFMINLLKPYSTYIQYGFGILFIIGFIVFTGISIDKNFDEALVLIVIGCLTVVLVAWDYWMAKWGSKIDTEKLFNSKLFKIASWLVGLGVVAAMLGFIIWDIFISGDEIKSSNLMGIAGLAFYTLFCVCCSVAPHRINWRPVIWGNMIQLALGIFVLRTTPGLEAFTWLGAQVELFLSFTDYGAMMVFGEDISSFAFGVLPIIIFFSMIISILYYVGFLPYVIGKISWLFEVSCDTSGPETTACAGNIFVGMTESPLLIRPYINDLTKSEICTVMVSGFASIAGSVMGAYMKMGISPTDLIVACVMSAPGALAVSKILYPELQKSRFRGNNAKKPDKLEATNVVEAASMGASTAIPLVANIAAMLIAFTSFIEWLNSLVSWLGECVGQDGWSFNMLLAYVFYPFVYLMGIPQDEVLASAELVGQKTFFNEFIAFTSLGDMIEHRKDGFPRCDCDDNVKWLSERGETLIVYALCGFSNLGAMGIMLGGMNGLAPKRVKTFAELVFLSLIGGVISCFARACITSLLYEASGDFYWGDLDISSFTFKGCEILQNGTAIEQPSCEWYYDNSTLTYP